MAEWTMSQWLVGGLVGAVGWITAILLLKHELTNDRAKLGEFPSVKHFVSSVFGKPATPARRTLHEQTVDLIICVLGFISLAPLGACIGAASGAFAAWMKWVAADVSASVKTWSQWGMIVSGLIGLCIAGAWHYAIAHPEDDGHRHSPGGRGPSLKTPARMDHFRRIESQLGKMSCPVNLVRCTTAGPNVVVVYRWEKNLSPQDADTLDSLVRAFLNCAVGDGAAAAGLSCTSGPPCAYLLSPAHPIPAWFIGGRSQPTYVVNSQVDHVSKTLSLTIGTPAVIVDRLVGFDAVASKLAKSLETLYRRIDER